MMRRIIENQGDLVSDERLREIGARLQASLDVDGDRPIDLTLLLEAERTASAIEDPGQREAVVRYISGLAEPQRTIFLKRIAGWSARDIAGVVGMELKPVCRSLATMYADLHALLSQTAA